MPQISHVTPSVPAIGCEISTIDAKIAPVASQLSLVAVPDVMPDFPPIALQLAAVASDFSCILAKLATINLSTIVVSAPAYNGMCGGSLRRGIGSSDHQSSGEEGGSCAQFRHFEFSGVVLAARVCAVSTR